MHNVKLNAAVTRADGTVFYQQQNEWNGIGDAALALFQDFVARSAGQAHTLHTKHKDEDDEKLNVNLTGSVDGVAVPSISETGVSYRTVLEFQKTSMAFGSQLIKLAESKAVEHHAKKHKQP